MFIWFIVIRALQFLQVVGPVSKEQIEVHLDHAMYTLRNYKDELMSHLTHAWTRHVEQETEVRLYTVD